MKKNLINSAVIVVDNLFLLKQSLNFLYKYNFKKIILLKKAKTKINKNIFSHLDLEIKEYSFKKFDYHILKEKKFMNKFQNEFLLFRTSKFVNINLFELYKEFKKNENKLVLTVLKNKKIIEITELFFLKKKLISNYDFSFSNIYKRSVYKLYIVNKEYLKYNKKIKIGKIKNFFSKIYSKSIILDRDGVINVNKGYVGYKKDFIFQPGAIRAIKYLNKNSIDVFVVSNQSGIARDYFSIDDVIKLHNYLRDQLTKYSATINKIYFSPYHIDGVLKKFKKNSSCRKPGIKLFKKLLREWGILDKSKIIMIGDQITDIQFASNAKINSLLFKGGNLYEFIKKIDFTF